MFCAIPNTEITYIDDQNRTVAANAVCLMDWPDATGQLTGRHRLMVVHDDRDPKWLDVRETSIFNQQGIRIPAWKLLNATDRKIYLYHAQKPTVGSRRAYWQTMGRDLKAKSYASPR